MRFGIRAAWLALALVSAARLPSPAQIVSPAQIPSTQVAIPPPASPADADAQFRAFLSNFRATAVQAGIDPQVYDVSTAGIVRNPAVEELNLQQPEFVKPIWDYLDGALSPSRITDGQALLAANAQMLANIEQRFGVQKEILVAIWGLETDYGREMGSFDIFEALATLAY
jgi:membrane-bound lytic murein transglycosylase B